ncbi:hypothetical protein JVT61DRAFT_4444 [Boletus reticuloceps]|uniref:Uncharacterized protein n=1 Tax=Boletus reticuloceps TaxID=495285 RepID=A0A8I2YNS8_9AGAM|nr:hypothetical protein JVT61DRAFT_4444 [Boletus reticuloceps]
MPASLSPFALIVPRPNIPPTVPPTFAPRTPNRSPVASHILLSPPSANRNSTDSWNSSNYDFEDPNAVWKEDQVRLLSRTLDALPAHLVTPFNGSVPPSNLLDKIARGISAAKGPNDWPHSIRATRVKLLEVARREAREERRKVITEERCVPLGSLAWQGDAYRAKTPDPAEVLQPRTNTPIHTRRPIYRQSSMDFMDSDKSDRSESIARLSNRLQHHDRVLHHPYLRPAHTRHRPELNKRSPSTPTSSTLNSNRHSGVRKSTISATSGSSSSFGSPMSISVPLRPSSLRRTSTLTLASASEVHADADADAENASKNADLRRSGGYPEANMDTKVAARVRRVPSCQHTEEAQVDTVNAVASQRRTVPNPSAGEMKPTPRTPPNEPRMLVPEKTTPTHVSTHTKKVRKGHKPQLSVSSDEEEKIRSKTAKKVRTREPSWSVPLAPAAQVQTSLLLSSVLPRDKGGYDSGRSSSTGIRSKASMSSSSSTDNDLSTASTETAATTVSNLSTSDAKHKSPRNPNFFIQIPPLQSPVEAKKPARRNPTRNPSMFGHELPHPQRTPASPSRIPVSSPMPLSPPMSSAATLTSTFSTSPPSTSSRPRTLRRAARRISFGSVAVNGSSLNPVENSRRHDGETPALGSAFQFA